VKKTERSVAIHNFKEGCPPGEQPWDGDEVTLFSLNKERGRHRSPARGPGGGRYIKGRPISLFTRSRNTLPTIRQDEKRGGHHQRKKKKKRKWVVSKMRENASETKPKPSRTTVDEGQTLHRCPVTHQRGGSDAYKRLFKPN